MFEKWNISLVNIFLLALPAYSGAADGIQPNVMLIISDDLGLDASSQYSLGTDLPDTPTLDSLASSGIVFDNTWATPACTTTRGTLITGLHGVNSGVDTVPFEMDTSLNTLQRLLKSDAATSNYQSAVFGKWHLAGRRPDHLHPNLSGVDHYAGNISGVLDDYSDWTLTTNGVTSQSNDYHTSAISDMAIDWIGKQKDPWFLWLAYAAPHAPFHLPPNELHSRDLSGKKRDIKQNKRDYYLASIEAMDNSIGTVLDSLSDQQKANTIIIYVGDNGTPGPVADKKVFSRSKVKNTLYEGGIRVPMTVSGAGVTRQGTREDALVNTVDIYATIAEATGAALPGTIDGKSFHRLLSDSNVETRDFNYAEFKGRKANGWSVRDKTYKLIRSEDGRQELYNLESDLRENNNLLQQDGDNYQSIVTELTDYAKTIRGEDSTSNVSSATAETSSLAIAVSDSIDLTDTLLTNASTDCASYANSYHSLAKDVNNGESYDGKLTISVSDDECVFSTNAIPNHDFNDGDRSFRNPVKAQDSEYRITSQPVQQEQTTALLLNQDNAVLLNGVKVDILAAGCFNVGDERTGCNDADQPWRYDPMHQASGFSVDSHNAHTQPNGAYHYHGPPNALYDSDTAETVVGFAADGFPIFGSYILDNGSIRKVRPGYRLKSGQRPDNAGSPGGTYDGTFRDDYEHVAGLGDLDECNGMQVGDSYGYFITDSYPYVLACFRGTPHESFNKRRGR